MTMLAPDALCHEAGGQEGDVKSMPARPTSGRTPTQIALKDALHLMELGFGLSSRELAQVLGVDPRTLASWAHSNTFPPATSRESRERFVAMLAVIRRLVDLFETTADMRVWMHRPLPFLGHTAPIEAVKMGRIESVEAALEAIDEGIAS
jgi:uncharacterized protein (DUF2384 family)